jgi:hypothetical protein
MGAFAWDARLRRVVLFGGTVNNVDLNDTWLYRDGAWTQAMVIGSVPPARWAPGVDYDADSKGLLLYGGFNFSHPFSDTWLLYPAP